MFSGQGDGYLICQDCDLELGEDGWRQYDSTLEVKAEDEANGQETEENDEKGRTEDENSELATEDEDDDEKGKELEQ